MLFLDISDTSIAVLYSRSPEAHSMDSIISGPVTDGVISNGIIHDEKKLATILTDLLSKGIPSPISHGEVAFVVTDKQVFTKIFPLPETVEKEKIAQYVLSEAKKFLPYEPTELENFYKVIEAESGKRIFYTAMSKATISHFQKFLKTVDLQLTLLYSRSQAMYMLLKSEIIGGKTLLYLDVGKKDFQYALFDEHGPLLINEKKYGTLSTTSLYELAAKLTAETGHSISHIVVGGSYSNERGKKEETEGEGPKLVLLSSLLEDLLPKLGITVDKGNTPIVHFANALGTLLLSQNVAAPNFAKDIANQKEEKLPQASEDENEEEDKNSPEVEKEKRDMSTSYFVSGSDMVVKQTSTVGRLLTKKTVGFLAGVIMALLIGIFFLGRVGGSGISLPFASKPTATPTPTLVPTNTPTPTVNPSLKRTDIKVSVENGTEKTGYAKEIASFLEEKGYKNVARGNADKTTYSSTIVRVKKSKEEYTQLIVSDIYEKFNAPDIEELELTSSFDVVIILGSS
ncbi:LytR C-terminal domain-containing protein [Candidatus Gottesmanbacteria bacterium]|nr:LytR C-terminal domain-containing protein [Candidatus Gottesmanbacteria bacterium]